MRWRRRFKGTPCLVKVDFQTKRLRHLADLLLVLVVVITVFCTIIAAFRSTTPGHDRKRKHHAPATTASEKLTFRQRQQDKNKTRPAPQIVRCTPSLPPLPAYCSSRSLPQQDAPATLAKPMSPVYTRQPKKQ